MGERNCFPIRQVTKSDVFSEGNIATSSALSKKSITAGAGGSRFSSRILRICARLIRISTSNGSFALQRGDHITVLPAFFARLVAFTALRAWNSRYVGSAKDTHVPRGGYRRRRSSRKRRRRSSKRAGRRRSGEQRLVSSPCYYLPCPVNVA